MLIKAWIFNNLQHYIGNKLSKDTGFSISSAERYSLALFELSEENNLLSQIEEQSLSVLNLINQSKDFFNLIKDPTTSQEDLSKVINKIEGKILGPVNAPLFRLKRKFRVRFLIRGLKSMKLQSSLAKIIPKYKFSSGIKLSVDVDPINFN